MKDQWSLLISMAALLASEASATTKRPAIYTPAPGSAERTAIVKTLHSVDGSGSRFTFGEFRVFRQGSRAIAYVRGEGAVGYFQALLKRDGKAPWRKVWGESDGGSDSCEAGAEHYDWALRLLRTFTIAPEALFPGVISRTAELKEQAKTDAELQCVGDLDGGPE